MRRQFIRIASILAVSLAPVAASADTAAEIDANVSETIRKFEASLSNDGEGSLQISGQISGKPVLAFVLDRKGLMANVTMEGSKITRIER